MRITIIPKFTVAGYDTIDSDKEKINVQTYFYLDIKNNVVIQRQQLASICLSSDTYLQSYKKTVEILEMHNVKYENLSFKKVVHPDCEERKVKLAIGIPTLNRWDLLQKNIETYRLFSQITESPLIIFDNGKQGVPAKKGHILLASDNNLGVSGSWNNMLLVAFKDFNEKATHMLMLNDDVDFTIEQLLRIYDMLHFEPEYDFYVSQQNWCAYILPRKTFELVGEFDSNFYPAYFEDNDYYRRMSLLSLSYHQTSLLNPMVYRNSMTIQKDPSVNKDFMKNKNYYVEKWGGEPHHEKYQTPFNK